ncbi:MAG TPA: peptidoglycan-binding domain-containing protein [Solirubrobacteraceae bacterium]
MARAAHRKRSTSIAVRVALLALCLLCSALLQPGPGSAASTGTGAAMAPAGGGTPPGGSSSSSTSTSSGKSTGGSSPKPITKTQAPAKRPNPYTLTSARCVPASHCSTNAREVSLGGELLIKGADLRKGMVVAFPHSWNARIASNSPTAHLASSTLGMVVHVPSSAHSGRIMILISHGRHTNSFGPIQIVRYALHPPAPPAPPVPPAPVASATPSGSAFNGQGMWIWYVSQSDGGNLASIVAQAHAAGVTTLYVKSSDGSSNYWSQFSPELVQQLHANGLRVCAWQYVYGTNPTGEAELGARAVATGADCLVIDAESEYEGHYGAAQTYIADLRAKIGATYPLGLASFPYVYDHTSFPYSVFLGPNGAQFNAPQMYWKDIGNSVDTAYANTYISNRVYGRPIFPLGQTYSKPSTEELVRFREEAPLYGATGTSFWDFQETPASLWAALATPLAPLAGVTPNPSWSELAEGSKGDPVLWMQEHLASAIPTQTTTGIFDATTQANLEQFQAAHGIAASGHTEAATWQALLALAPVAVNWTGAGPKG